MKQLLFFGIVLLCACNNSPKDNNANKTTTGSDLYFEFTVDGKFFTISDDDVSTRYNKFGDNVEFKIFAGADESTSLTLTIPNDMSKPSSTPSGSSSIIAINNGSVSLQSYPSKEYTFNSYDFTANPKTEPVPDAIVVTGSELLGNNEGRIITGTINVTTVINNAPDDINKPYKIVGKFRVKHLFNGNPF